MVVSAMEMLIGGVSEEDWGLLIGYNAQSVPMHYECPGILITQYTASARYCVTSGTMCIFHMK